VKDAAIVALTSVMHMPRIAPCATECSVGRVLPSINGPRIPRSRMFQNITIKGDARDSDPAPKFILPIFRPAHRSPNPRAEQLLLNLIFRAYT
jgi:hypothetical protein